MRTTLLLLSAALACLGGCDASQPPAAAEPAGASASEGSAGGDARALRRAAVAPEAGLGDAGGARNRAMGTGVPREPQPFTLEQRALDAVRRGDRETLLRALERGVPVDVADDLDRTALLLAARDAGSLALVRLLHERGADVDRPDLGGRTALSHAAGAGRLEIVRFLIREGARVDRADDQGRTPLFHAALAGHREVMSELLARGAEVDVQDRFGDTPLMLACAKGLAPTAELLLDHGADPGLRNQEGRTARDRAAAGSGPCLAGPGG